MNLYGYTGNDPVNNTDPTGQKQACVTTVGEDGTETTTCEDLGETNAEQVLSFYENHPLGTVERGSKYHLAVLQAKVVFESIDASLEAGGSWVDGVLAAAVAAQIRSGILTTPEQDPTQFEKKTGEDGKPIWVNKKDGSVWSKERGGDRAHGGSDWKRWPNKRDYKNGNDAKRMTIRANGSVRDAGKSKSRSGTRKRK